MSIRTDILALPELMNGKRLTVAEIAAILGRPRSDVSSTIGNMVRTDVLLSHKRSGTKTRTYSIPGPSHSLNPFRARLDAIWRPTRSPEELAL